MDVLKIEAGILEGVHTQNRILMWWYSGIFKTRCARLNYHSQYHFGAKTYQRSTLKKQTVVNPSPFTPRSPSYVLPPRWYLPTFVKVFDFGTTLSTTPCNGVVQSRITSKIIVQYRIEDPPNF